MFKAGDEVVCVNFADIGFETDWNPPEEGAIYTVTDVFMFRNEPHVRLSEIQNICDIGYRARRFRKVQRKTTDLSIESFLTIKPSFEEPRKVTAPVREKA